MYLAQVVRAKYLTSLMGLAVGLALPLVYRFGPSNGLMTFTLLTILVPAGALLWEGANGCMDLLEAFGNRWLDQPLFALGVLIAVLLLGVGSLRLSEHSYRRRTV